MNVALGFFFMGYNLAVFNTMIRAMTIIFEWSEENKSTLISICSAIVPIGALFGGVGTGFLATKIGRKRSIIIIDIVGMIGAGIACIGNTESFLIGRFIMGLAVGGFSTVIPVYIEEFVPLSLVGKYGMINFFFFFIGNSI